MFSKNNETHHRLDIHGGERLRGVATGKDVIIATGPVEIPARRYIIDDARQANIYGRHAVRSSEGGELRGREFEQRHALGALWCGGSHG